MNKLKDITKLHVASVRVVNPDPNPTTTIALTDRQASLLVALLDSAEEGTRVLPLCEQLGFVDDEGLMPPLLFEDTIMEDLRNMRDMMQWAPDLEDIAKDWR